MTPRIFLYGKNSHVVHVVVRDQRRYTGTRYVVVHLQLVINVNGYVPMFHGRVNIGKVNGMVEKLQVQGRSAVQLSAPFVEFLPLVVLKSILKVYFRSIRQMIMSCSFKDAVFSFLLAVRCGVAKIRLNKSASMFYNGL